MATGISSYYDVDTSSSLFKIRVHWSETYDPSTNRSTVTIDSVQVKSTGWYGISYYPDGNIKINGQVAISMDANRGDYIATPLKLDEWTPIRTTGSKDIATGSATVIHNEDGSGETTIEFCGNRYTRCYFYTISGEYGSGWYCTDSRAIALTTIPTYTLSISSGSGSSIAVNRTASGFAGTGSIADGTRLYYGDLLRITFTPDTNYRLVETAVNGSSFTSGNTHTVTDNVDVVSVAQILSSSIGAADANIGSISTITVTQYNKNYFHSLWYSFGSLSGYITSSGGIQNEEVKFQNTSVAFSVPESFYAQIPNAKSGICTITCKTYETETSTSVLGSATTCTFVATASQVVCSPTVTSTIRDINEITKVLTGNENFLIRHRSTVQCTITAIAKNSAQISTIQINNITIPGTPVTTSVGSGMTGSLTIENVDKNKLSFLATDTRGYLGVKSMSVTMIPYVILTCNPVIARPTPTGKIMTISITGNVYNGSFGAHSNKLTIRYRYKAEGDGEVYSSWNTLDAESILFGTSNYRTNGAVSLPDEFDYQKSYVFEVVATDGIDGYVLSTARSTVPVQRGVPVFDWGEDDFNFNVDVRVKNINLLDIFYPVGSIFMSVNDEIPQTLLILGGTWEPMTPTISGVYQWKRIL